jgi:hypothetical protein
MLGDLGCDVQGAGGAQGVVFNRLIATVMRRTVFPLGRPYDSLDNLGLTSRLIGRRLRASSHRRHICRRKRRRPRDRSPVEATLAAEPSARIATREAGRLKVGMAGMRLHGAAASVITTDGFAVICRAQDLSDQSSASTTSRRTRAYRDAPAGGRSAARRRRRHNSTPSTKVAGGAKEYFDFLRAFSFLPVKLFFL